jgi:hypothetical protein
LTSASSASAVGQTSGHWVKPKNTTTTLPAKSLMVRGWPLWSVSWKSRAYSAPVMSMARNCGLSGEQAASVTSGTDGNRLNKRVLRFMAPQ